MFGIYIYCNITKFDTSASSKHEYVKKLSRNCQALLEYQLYLTNIYCDFRNLQVALEKLKEYQRKHESMKSLTEKVNREQSTRTDRVTRNAEYNQHVHNRRHSDTATMGEHCELTRPGDEQSIECLWKRHTRETDFSYNSSDADVRFSNIPITDEELERIREHAIHERQLLKHEGIAGEVNPNKPRPHDSRQDYSKPLRPPTYAAGEATTPVSYINDIEVMSTY